MGLAEEIATAGFTEYEQQVLDWLRDVLIQNPTIDNRSLTLVVRQSGGSVPVVNKLRGRARDRLGIMESRRGGTIDVEKFISSGACTAEEWTVSRSREILDRGWYLLNDPHGLHPPERKPREKKGRRRSVLQVVAEAESAGADLLFCTAVENLRHAMRLLDVRSVTVSLGRVSVVRSVFVAPVAQAPVEPTLPSTAAPPTGQDET